MDTPVLAVRHVSKSFAGVRALVDIDLEIAPGEIHCLAGENGSGKSTLIKVISGVHTPEHRDGLDRGPRLYAPDACRRHRRRRARHLPGFLDLPEPVGHGEHRAGQRSGRRASPGQPLPHARGSARGRGEDRLRRGPGRAGREPVRGRQAAGGHQPRAHGRREAHHHGRADDRPHQEGSERPSSTSSATCSRAVSRSSSCPTSSRRSSRSRSASRSCAPATRSSPARRRSSTARVSPAT